MKHLVIYKILTHFCLFIKIILYSEKQAADNFSRIFIIKIIQNQWELGHNYIIETQP